MAKGSLLGILTKNKPMRCVPWITQTEVKRTGNWEEVEETTGDQSGLTPELW